MAETWRKTGTKQIGEENGEPIYEDVYEISDTQVIRTVSASDLDTIIARETDSIARLEAKTAERQAVIDRAEADKIELSNQ